MEERKRRGWGGAALIVTMMVAAAAAGAIPVTMFSGHVNGRVSGFDKLDVNFFKAHPNPSKFYTEVWFHEMQFKEQGIIVIVQLQVHNLGLGSGYCDSYLTVSDATGLYGSVDSQSPDQVKIDPQGFGITAGQQRIQLVGDQYRVTYRGKGLSGDFVFKPLTGSFQQGSGKALFPGTDDFVQYNFPIPWAEITGTLTYNGKTLKLAGVGSMNHDYQILSPTRYPSQWRAFWCYGPDATVSIVRCSSPDLGGQWVQRLMVAEKGKILFSSHDYKFESADLKPVAGGAVPCANTYRVEARSGQDLLKGEIKVSRIQEKADVLQGYPALFRKMAELLVKETWSYRFWMDFRFELTMDGKTRVIEGKGTGDYVDSVKAK